MMKDFYSTSIMFKGALQYQQNLKNYIKVI